MMIFGTTQARQARAQVQIRKTMTSLYMKNPMPKKDSQLKKDDATKVPRKSISREPPTSVSTNREQDNIDMGNDLIDSTLGS
jgi:hypothetical protein